MNEPAKKFGIQKLYIKDASFESPNTPKSFSYQKWDPKIDLNLTNSNTELGQDMYEVVLRVTATATIEEQTTFLVEVQYAGLFTIAGFDESEHSYMVGSQCMGILFPYAREVVSDLTARGGFPPLTLAPVNFDALYQQHLQNQAETEAADAPVAH